MIVKAFFVSILWLAIATGPFDEWPAPSGAEAHPYAMAADADGRLWFGADVGTVGDAAPAAP